ncbi:S8 family serine peptidase [Microbacterium sp. BH-3-3-3]|uniref:S8 family serine peptidase n=1 Tax=Microbacterium sp. BH-3-3-3 TaxID=1906742 RepID=UPI00119CF4C7|nr:S8 family serine peptidase [Microbacterium sp. BH-3-3-3]
MRRRGAGSFRALAIGAVGALLVTGGVVLAVWPSGASAPLASVASEPSVPDAVAQVSASDDPQTAANLASIDEWVNDLGIPVDATADERLQAKLAYDLVTVPLSDREEFLSLPGVTVVAPVTRDDSVTGAVLRTQSDTVRASIPDATVEANQIATTEGDQTPVPSWGLDVVDNSASAQDNHYLYDTTGAGTTVFVMDTGIVSSLPDFGGRVDAAAGKTFINDGNGTEDCSGHGTHVAGTVGSTTYGVAKQTKLIPVRVEDCDGKGTTTDIWYALNWITDNYKWADRMVINMSIGSAKANNVNSMISFANSRGFVVVGAAGNEQQDACNTTPASAARTITVASYDNRLQWSSQFSNYGPCVDILAPGQDIRSLWYQGGARMESGTSMAAPHVSGLAARLLEAHPSWTSADVMGFFQTSAATGHISGVPANTVNLVAAIPVAPTVPKITSLTTGAVSSGISLAWTTNGVGTFTTFAITVTDTTTGRSYPVTVGASRSSTVFTDVIPGHTYTISITGTATMPSGAVVTTDPATAAGP